MAIVIGDVHGCFKTMEALLKKLPDDKIYFVGDLIDRGPRSKEVIQFLMDHPEIESVRGNHEDWALDVISNATFSNVVSWTHPQNGGDSTLESYGDRGSMPVSKLIPKDHQYFMDGLPEYLIDGDLFISHSSYCGFDWNNAEDLEDIRNWDKRRSLLWHRGTPKKVIKDGKEYFHIFGHTPVPGAVLGEFYANIDTGACFGGDADKAEGYGILTALQYPSMKIWTQENVD